MDPSEELIGLPKFSKMPKNEKISIRGLPICLKCSSAALKRGETGLLSSFPVNSALAP